MQLVHRGCFALGRVEGTEWLCLVSVNCNRPTVLVKALVRCGQSGKLPLDLLLRDLPSTTYAVNWSTRYCMEVLDLFSQREYGVTCQTPLVLCNRKELIWFQGRTEVRGLHLWS